MMVKKKKNVDMLGSLTGDDDDGEGNDDVCLRVTQKKTYVFHLSFLQKQQRHA